MLRVTGKVWPQSRPDALGSPGSDDPPITSRSMTVASYEQAGSRGASAGEGGTSARHGEELTLTGSVRTRHTHRRSVHGHVAAPDHRGSRDRSSSELANEGRRALLDGYRRPWGNPCQPIVFDVAPNIPRTVYTQVAAVVGQAQAAGLDVTIVNLGNEWYPDLLYRPWSCSSPSLRGPQAGSLGQLRRLPPQPGH